MIRKEIRNIFLIILAFLSRGCWCLTDMEHIYAKEEFEFLSSPLYPHDFPAQTTYTWRITTRLGYVIYLEFTKFSLIEPVDGGKCPRQVVVLSDGDYEKDSDEDSSGEQLRYCGRKIPSALVSTGRQVTIALESDFSGRGEYPQHFIFKYKSVTPSKRPSMPMLPPPSVRRPSYRLPPSTNIVSRRPYLGDYLNGRIRMPARRQNPTVRTTTARAPLKKKFRLPDHVKIMLYVFVPAFILFIVGMAYMKYRGMQAVTEPQAIKSNVNTVCKEEEIYAEVR